MLRRQWSCEHDEIVAVVRGLKAHLVSLPCEAKVRITSVPGVRAGKYLLCAGRLPAYQSIAEISVATLGCVVLQADVNREALRQ